MQFVNRFVLCCLLTAFVILNAPNWTATSFLQYSKQPVPKQDYKTFLYYQNTLQSCVGQYVPKPHMTILLAAIYNDIDPWEFKTLAESAGINKFTVNCVLKKINPET